MGSSGSSSRAWGDGRYAEHIRSLRCLLGCNPPSHPHHVKSRGAGGTWRDLVPLCPEHHSMIHTIGRKTFARRFGKDLERAAEEYLRSWNSREGTSRESGMMEPL